MTAAVAVVVGVVTVVETPDPPPALPDLGPLRAHLAAAWPTLDADARIVVRRAVAELHHYTRRVRQPLP